MSDINGLICQEKIAKEESDHALHCQYLFWKERSKMFWFKDGDRNTAFSILWSKEEIILAGFIVYGLTLMVYLN